MTIASEIELQLKNNLEYASGPSGPSNSRGHAYAKVPEWQLRQCLAALTAPVAGADAGTATYADLSRVLDDLYDEIGCEHDNEAALVAVSKLVDLLRRGAADMTTDQRYVWKQEAEVFLKQRTVT